MKMKIDAGRMKTLAAPFAATASRFISFALLVVGSLAAAPFAAAQATAPPLGTAQGFAVLGYSTVTNTGPTIVTGNLGVSPGSAVTGFPPGIVAGGTTYTADAASAQAQTDTGTAYVALAGETCTEDLSGKNLGGLTLTPGVYCFSSSAQLTGTLTLNAESNAAAVWVFKIGSTLTTASNSSVVLEGGQPCNVFWQVGSSATLGTTTNFTGSILALTSITLDTDTTVSGRTLARNGAVTLDANTVAIASCAAQGAVSPLLSKAFSPSTIKAGATSTLTLTLTNPDSAEATLKSPLVDALPSGMTIAETGSTTCAGGVVSAAKGGSAVTLSAGSIPAASSCTVTALITAASGGNYINSLAAGALETNTGSSAAPAIATLTVTPVVTAPPALGKAFSPSTITAGGTSTLTLTLSNSASAASGLTVPLIDTLPSGVTVSALGSTTCGGTVTGSKGSPTVTLTGGSIPADGSCTVTALVTAPAVGSYFNSITAGALKTSEGSSASPAVATLTVTPIVAPSLSKSFNPSTITAGGTSTLILTLSNTSSTAAALTASLADSLPSGMTLSGDGSTTCGGTVSGSKGSGTLTLTGGSIPASGHCTVTASVTAAAVGSYVNSLVVGALKTGNGSSPTAAVATLTVTAVAVPTLSKSFSPSTITVGGTSTLIITLGNANTISDSLAAALVDALPSGLTLSAPGTTTCGGTVTGSKGSGTLTLTGGSIPASGHCTVTASVTASAVGTYVNSIPIGALKTGNGSCATAAVATLTVVPVAAPTLSKSFSPETITVGGTSTLIITLGNANTFSDSLSASLVDALPSGLTLSAPGTTTCGGTVTGVKGSGTLTLTGGSIPASGHCTMTASVTAAAVGSYVNTLAIGALKTGNGSSAAAAVATLTVSAVVAPTLSKSFSPSSINAGGTTTLTITLSNSNSTVATITAPLSDNLPSGMTVFGSGTTTCGGTVTGSKGASTVSLSGGSIPADGHCTVSVEVTVTNLYNNTMPAGALQTSLGSNKASANAGLTIK